MTIFLNASRQIFILTGKERVNKNLKVTHFRQISKTLEVLGELQSVFHTSLIFESNSANLSLIDPFSFCSFWGRGQSIHHITFFVLCLAQSSPVDA